MSKETAPQVKSVSLSAIKEDLNNGLTKWKKDDIGFGSIEKKYNLLTNEAVELFSHPRVKTMETRIPTFIIVDDLPEDEIIKGLPELPKNLVTLPVQPKQDPIIQSKIEVVKQIVKPKIEAFI